MTPPTKWKIKLAIALAGTLTGLSLLGWACWSYRDQFKSPPSKKLTSIQDYELGRMVGIMWTEEILAGKTNDFIRGFRAGVVSALGTNDVWQGELRTNK